MPIAAAFLVAALWTQFSTDPPTPPDFMAADRAFEIDLGADFVSKATLTLPSPNGPFPTVILFHGSGPSDMDATMSGAAGEPPISTNFKTIAANLRQDGIASVRFNKRGVFSATDYDWEQVQRSTLNQLIDDAEAVIDATLALPEVDPDRLFLFGWSQGAQVAVHVAKRRPELAGLILQGAPTSGWEGIFRHEHLKLGLPHLAEHSDNDGDGKLSLEELYALPYQPITPVGMIPMLYIWADDSSPAAPRIRPEVDRNGDDLIDIERELRPAIVAQIEGPTPNRMIPSGSEPAERIADVVPRLDMPILALHGENDGWVPVEDAWIIANAAPDRVTLRTFPNLGHALDWTPEPAVDVFRQSYGLAAECIANWLELVLNRDAPRPIIQPRDTDFAVALPKAMQDALDDVAAGFQTYRARDYAPGSGEWIPTLDDAPFAVIGDFNGDDTADVVMHGHTETETMRLALMSNGAGFDVIELERGAYDDPAATVLDGFVGFWTYMTKWGDYPVPQHVEETPLILEADAFTIIHAEKAGSLYYWKDGAFHPYGISD